MSITSFLLKGISIAFNAFVSRRLGADGMGLFTLIMSVYGLFVTFAASGVNLAATRMCAERLGQNDCDGAAAAMRRCLTYALLCGCTAASLLYFGAEYVASAWLGDGRCTASLKLLAVSLPFIAASNVLHGYFTAVRKAAKSAACQIFEQLFKTAFCAFLLLNFVPVGIEYACMALVGGGALAEFLSFSMAFILYLADKKRKSVAVSREKGRRLTAEMLSITIPVALAAYIRSGLSTLEHVLIPKGLAENPLTADTALATYGVFCGMVMPVVMFPTAILYSFTALLIPEFAEAKTVNNRARIRSMTSRALGLTVIFSVGCAAVMWRFSKELGIIMYQNSDAGVFIGVMAPLIPIMYLDHAVDAILKGMGEQIYCMKVNIADAALCTLLVYILCPTIGIWGYILTIYLAEIMNFSLSFYRLVRLGAVRMNTVRRFVMPCVCALAAVLALKAVPFFGGEGLISSVGGMLYISMVYCVLLFVTGTVSRKDMEFVRCF